MSKVKLTNVEFESILLYVFVALSMSVRGVFLLTMSNVNILESDFYLLMHAIIPVQVWGLFMLVGSAIVMASVLSMTMRKYGYLIIGNSIGLIFGGAMTLLGFAEGMNLFTPLQIGIIAFFNLVLIVHGGVVLWNERKRIHTSHKST